MPLLIQFLIRFKAALNSKVFLFNKVPSRSVNNKMLLKETMLIRNALDDNLFRYDASELMERRIGADHLLSAMRSYILMGNKFITEITEELDSNY